MYSLDQALVSLLNIFLLQNADVLIALLINTGLRTATQDLTKFILYRLLLLPMIKSIIKRLSLVAKVIVTKFLMIKL